MEGSSAIQVILATDQFYVNRVKPGAAETSGVKVDGKGGASVCWSKYPDLSVASLSCFVASGL